MKYKPSLPFITPLLLIPPVYETQKGVVTKKYDRTNGTIIYATFKTYGGTERITNELYTVEDTATLETWYRPEVTADCRIEKLSDGKLYEIMGEPEDIEQRHQYLKFKIRRVAGGA